MARDKRTPNDQRSDSMNPNNPLSDKYLEKVRRLAKQADSLEELLDGRLDRLAEHLNKQLRKAGLR